MEIPNLSTQELDLINRSTKKIKVTNGENSLPGGSAQPQGEDFSIQQDQPASNSISYKESLLQQIGLQQEQIFEVDDIIFPHEDSEEEKYLFQESEVRPLDPCPRVPISEEEYSKWCRSWQNSLVVQVMGKKVSMRFL
ncbi:hypothetical protein SESBI_09138 [Sesbania bispinosa]|nr:hypothetical protein SESBI_09138 [Sesbania bispinosa]